MTIIDWMGSEIKLDYWNFGWTNGTSALHPVDLPGPAALEAGLLPQQEEAGLPSCG